VTVSSRACLFGCIGLGLLFSACDPIGGKPQERSYVSLKVENSFCGDDIRVLLMTPVSHDTLDTVWSGPLLDSSSLSKLPTRRYAGGPVDVVVQCRKADSLAYWEIIQYRYPGERPIIALHDVSEDFPKLAGLASGDTEFIVQGENFHPASPVCRDDYGREIPVRTTGQVDTQSPGTYKLSFDCVDSLGRRSAVSIQNVKVVSKDSLDPVVIFPGKDTVRMFVGDKLRDSVAWCLDYSHRQLPITTTGRIDTSRIGIYRLKYSCTDKLGNSAERVRIVKIYRPSRDTYFLSAEKETSIDVFDQTHNQNLGYNGYLVFSRPPQDKYVTLLKFDLGQVKLDGLKAATLRFNSFGFGSNPWPDTAVPLTFYLYALKSGWIEGTGNFFYYDGKWRNSGEAIFSNYGIPESVKEKSVSDTLATGISNRDRSLVALENLTLIDSIPMNLTYSSKHGARVSIPPLRDLVVIDLDVTNYVLNSRPESDHGFVVKVGGSPSGEWLCFLTKEAGDGSYGPTLILEY
jgi:hypothetical protein